MVQAPEPVGTPDPCILPTGAPGEPRELLVAAAGPEDSAATAASQSQPLIRLDCLGAPRPAAAESWSADSSHRSWTFVLARSPSGITPGTVAAEWRARPEAAMTLRQAGVASLVPLDNRRLVVTLHWASDSLPVLFADPSLSLVTDSLPPTGTTFVLRRPVSGDLRDALDDGADIARTGDPTLADYARTRGEFAVHPLPWTLTYLLILPADPSGLDSLISEDSTAFRAALARDAVHTEARGAEPPYWWDAPGDCPVRDSVPRSLPPPFANAVAFTSGDAVARALAERVVALSSNPTTSTASLPERVMARALPAGSASAYVISVPRLPLLPCREVARWPADARVIPLIDTRMSAIVRRGVPPLTADFDGRLRPADQP